MTENSVRRFVPYLLLAIAMGVTRFSNIGAELHLQDASWAVFFLGGFYLTREWKWALPLLLAEAIAIDWIAVGTLGVSNYCLTVAYWFIIPSYSALWLGGAWFRGHYAMNLRSLGLLIAVAFLSISLCYLLSNGSFYWLGGRAAPPTFAGWFKNFSDWYWPFLRVPLFYIGVVAFVHVIAVQAGAMLAARSNRREP